MMKRTFQKAPQALLVMVFIIVIYALLSLAINKSIVFTVEPRACKYGFCISGLPMELDIKWQEGINGTFKISSNALLENKQEVTGSSSSLTFTGETKNNLPARSYSFKVKAQQSMWNIFFDPFAYIEYSLIGKSVGLDFKYPDVRVISIEEVCWTEVGVNYTQINLQSYDGKDWQCKLRLSMIKDSKVSNSNLSKIGTEEYRDLYESVFGIVPGDGGKTYGISKTVIKSPECKDRIVVDIIPVCLVEGKEINISYSLNMHTKECKLHNLC